MSKCSAGLLATLIALAPAAAAAQTAPPSGQTFTLSTIFQRGHQAAQRNLLEAAEKMPEGDYGFKPTAEVRPFGHIVAHIALTQFAGCSTLKGEPNPQKTEKEDAARSKTDLIALLKASQAYCDSAFGGITDDALTQLTKAGPNEVARGAFLHGSIVHANETYGTMAVYLRLKGIVPPSTERQNNQRRGSQ